MSLQKEAHQWRLETFDHNIFSLYKKMEKEFHELGKAIHQQASTGYEIQVIDECADVGLILMMIAEEYGVNLYKAMADKLAKNKHREWEKIPDGTYQHIEDNKG